jgi:hypothetical protein
MAFVRFFSATFGTGVNASHCPITRPKRRIQSERYAKYRPTFLQNIIKHIDKNKVKKYTQ